MEPQVDWIYSYIYIYIYIHINSALYGREKLIHSLTHVSRQHGRHISIKMRLGGLQRCSGRYEE